MPTPDVEDRRVTTPEPVDSDSGLVSPRKTARLLTALQATYDEIKQMPIDEAARRRLVALHEATLIELASTVSDALIDELVRLHVAPLDLDASPSQIRVAQMQLLGWVAGLLATGGMVKGEPVAADGRPPGTPQRVELSAGGRAPTTAGRQRRR